MTELITKGRPPDPSGEKARIVLIKEVACLVLVRSRSTGDTLRLAALMVVVTVCVCVVLWTAAHGATYAVLGAF